MHEGKKTLESHIHSPSVYFKVSRLESGICNSGGMALGYGVSFGRRGSYRQQAVKVTIP